MPWIYNNGNPTLVSDRVARQRGGLIANRPSEDHVYNPATQEITYMTEEVLDSEGVVITPSVEATRTEVIGWEIPVELLITKLKTEINKAREIKYGTGIIFDSHRFTYEDSIGLITMVMKINDGQVNPHGGYWRDADNNDYYCDDIKIKLLSDSLSNYLAQVSRESHIQKDNLSSKSYDELNQFNVDDIPWPENIFNIEETVEEPAP